MKAEGNELEEERAKEKWHYEKVKIVKLFLKPGQKKMSQRMCLSEHPFGTIKRVMENARVSRCSSKCAKATETSVKNIKFPVL